MLSSLRLDTSIQLEQDFSYICICIFICMSAVHLWKKISIYKKKLCRSCPLRARRSFRPVLQLFILLLPPGSQRSMPGKGIPLLPSFCLPSVLKKLPSGRANKKSSPELTFSRLNMQFYFALDTSMQVERLFSVVLWANRAAQTIKKARNNRII